MTTLKQKKKLLIVIGTRPEAIKLAPIVVEAERSGQFDVRLVGTGQHREMLDQMIRQFDLQIDIDLNIMRPDQTLCKITTSALDGLHRVIGEQQPDCVIVQGDTTTTFCGALAASYHHIPVAHVEAGLRTYDREHPFPEEMNRCLTTQLSAFHFAPTIRARDNLIREGIPPERLWVTGNTAIDALKMTLAKADNHPASSSRFRTILLTTHRRENHGEPMKHICSAILRIVERFSDVRVVFPVHLSPRVRSAIFPILSNHERIELIEPLDYSEFVLAMNESYLILTDSGGVQEEAPSLGKPVLVLRDVTERPEAIEAGVAIAVGTDEERIVTETSKLFLEKDHYIAMSEAKNPYGDGTAANQIIQTLMKQL